MINSYLKGSSLLSRSWMRPILLAFTLYATVQLGMIFNSWYYASNAACIAPKFSGWTWYANFVEVVAFCAAVFIQLSHCFLAWGGSVELGCISTSCAINIIAAISSSINLLTDWVGICEDSLGVRLPGAIIAEWFVCVPLLFYIVLATGKNTKLSKIENIILILVTTTFLLKIVSQLCNNFTVTVILVSASALCYTIASSLFYYVTFYKYHSDRSRVSCSISTPINDYTNCLTKTQIQLAMCLLIILPLFPVIYLLSLLRVIDHDLTYVLTISLNIFSKFMFLSIINSAYIQVTTDIANIVLSTQLMALRTEKEANEARRLFVRYIMHEVRVPLNSITMGLGYLKQDPLLDEEAKDAILMMDGATGFMKQTLNNVLNMQRIEEGKLELDYIPFSIETVIQRVKASMQGSLTEKQIRLVINIASTVPNLIIGDGFRIEHVLVNLLSNALKFSRNDSEIVLEIRPESHSFNSILKKDSRSLTLGVVQSVTNLSNGRSKKTENNVTLLFSVTDQGPGIAESDLYTLFIPFSQIRPHELQSGGGSGIGLVICKQIVELHGGTITCTSKLGVGSTFSFTIPFYICNSSKNNSGKFTNQIITDKTELSHLPTSTIIHILADNDNDSALPSSTIDPYRIHHHHHHHHSNRIVSHLPNFHYFDKSNNDSKDSSDSHHHSIDSSRHNTLLTTVNISDNNHRNSFICSIDSNNNINNNNNENRIDTNNSLSICTHLINLPEIKDNITLPTPLPTTVEEFLTSYVEVLPRENHNTRNGNNSNAILSTNGLLLPSSDFTHPIITTITHHKAIKSALIVDDVLSNRKLLALNLKRLGIECTTAIHGKEALELVQHQIMHFDIIFMDNSMPIMNGIDATKELRAIGYNHLIVGVTGNAMMDDVAEFIAAGADAVILKPASVQEIYQIIEYVGNHGNMHHEKRSVVFFENHYEILDH